MRARCPRHGRFMRFKGPALNIAATVPLGLFDCSLCKSYWTLVIPWAWVKQ